MAQAEEHLRELLKLSAKERVRAAKRLLESVDDPSVSSEVADLDSEICSLEPLETSTGSAARRDEIESTDEYPELDEAVADEEELRSAVRAAIRVELEPLQELTLLLRRFAEHARATGQALHARTI